MPPPSVTAPPFETIDEPVAIKIPPWATLSESAQRVTGPPFDCRALLIKRFAVAFKTIGASALVLALIAAPVVMFPAGAVTVTPPSPAEVIAPVPVNAEAVTETEPFAFKVPAPVYAPLPITVMFPPSVVPRFEPTATALPQTSMFPLIAAGVEIVIADVLPDLPKAK